MKLEQLRRTILLKIMVAIAAMTFLSISAATKQKTTYETIVHTVEIYQFKFVPDRLQLRPGDSVLWVNRDIVPHTATALDDSWDTGEIQTDERKPLVFNEDSSTSYYCRFHPSMVAELQIIVDR